MMNLIGIVWNGLQLTKQQKGMKGLYELNGLEYDTVHRNGRKTIEYINIECGFDIETTSVKLSEEDKVSFMYAWVFGIKDENLLFRGRTWEEFIILCERLQEHFQLNEDRRLIVYVHNLGFEFQFMRKYFEWVKVFSMESRRPISALSNYGIEFRDSLILSGQSLENVAKNLVHHKIEKKVGNLDYNLVRHHGTELTEEEWGYIEHDVLIILYYINEQMQMYGNNIARVPQTNTARVRNFVRHNCYYTSRNHSKSDGNKYRKYRDLMNSLQLDTDSYMASRNAFMGGYVHANANEVGKIIDDVVSVDITSSYPAVMVSEKFPMSPPIKIDNKDKDFDFNEHYRSNKYNLIFTVRFKNIISKFPYENYISESHCFRIVNPIVNNGRVFSADELIMTITDVDFNIIENTYEWEQMQVTDVYKFYSAYLPKPIIESIAELYEKKTELKGVEGKELEYVLSKGMLNSIYGMTVTDIIKDDNVYKGKWKVKEAEVDKKIKAYNENQRRFLYYPWGVFVTAYARRNLWYGITAVGKDYIYSDTDSIKLKNYDKHKKFFTQYNKMITKKVERMCKHHDIDPKRFAPKTIEGKKKPIGVWELDGHYSKFKTLGAKRYIVSKKNDC